MRLKFFTALIGYIFWCSLIFCRACTTCLQKNLLCIK